MRSQEILLSSQHNKQDNKSLDSNKHVFIDFEKKKKVRMARRMTRKNFIPTPKQKQEIVRLVTEDRISPQEVGKNQNISANTIREWVKKEGKILPIRYKKKDPSQYQYQYADGRACLQQDRPQQKQAAGCSAVATNNKDASKPAI